MMGEASSFGGGRLVRFCSWADREAIGDRHRDAPNYRYCGFFWMGGAGASLEPSGAVTEGRLDGLASGGGVGTAAGLAMFVIGFVFWGTPLSGLAISKANDAQSAALQLAMAQNLTPGAPAPI